MFLRSIRFTLTLWNSVILTAILLVFSVFIFATLKNQLYTETDKDLLVIAEAIASPTLEPFRACAPSVFDQVLEDFLGTKVAGKYVQVFDLSGKEGARTSNLESVSIPLTPSLRAEASRGKTMYSTHFQSAGGYPIRVVTYPVFIDATVTQLVQVGDSLLEASETLKKVLIVFAVSIPLCLILLGYGGWFLACRALKPVDAITKSAQKITAENLGERLNIVNADDEIGQLAGTINGMLARLEGSFTRVRQFSSDVSHELRTPLTIMRGEIEVAIRWAKEPEEFREILSSNLDEIKRMTDIIEHLLELARAEEGKLVLDIQEVDVYHLVSQIVPHEKLHAREKGVSIIVEGEHLMAFGDQLRLRMVLINLLDNAVKHTEAGGEVKVTVLAENEYVKISVLDHGPGIQKEEIPRIFDRFYRTDLSRNRAFGGSGLGLSLVKTIAEAHGGKVAVNSEFGNGTEFIVYLPSATTITSHS